MDEGTYARLATGDVLCPVGLNSSGSIGGQFTRTEASKQPLPEISQFHVPD